MALAKEDLLATLATLDETERQAIRESIAPVTKEQRLTAEKAARRAELTAKYNAAQATLDALAADEEIPTLASLLA